LLLEGHLKKLKEETRSPRRSVKGKKGSQNRGAAKKIQVDKIHRDASKLGNEDEQSSYQRTTATFKGSPKRENEKGSTKRREEAKIKGLFLKANGSGKMENR